MTTINCDQVADIMGALDLFHDMSDRDLGPRRNLLRDVRQLGALLEVMRILDLEFEDKAAAGNALSRLIQFNRMRGIDG